MLGNFYLGNDNMFIIIKSSENKIDSRKLRTFEFKYYHVPNNRGTIIIVFGVFGAKNHPNFAIKIEFYKIVMNKFNKVLLEILLIQKKHFKPFLPPP